MRIKSIFVEDVDVGNRLRPINERTAVALAESMQCLGQLVPISVYRKDDDTLRLVTGLHRLEAAKRLGWKEIEAVFSTGNEIERELQEIAENLHRSELTALERDTQIGRWAELRAAKVGQVDPPSGGAQPAEKGVRKVARELNLGRKDVERAVKVASISPEAKQAARVAGLDDNRAALLAVAKEATPEAQVAKVGAISSAKTVAKAKDQVAATNVVEATHLVGAVNRFAEFCRANSPASVAAGILPGEVAEVRVSIAVIREWRGEFFAALGRVEATDIAAKAAEGPRGPDVVPLVKHVPVAAARDPWRDLDIPPFLDRRKKAPPDVSKLSMEVPAPKTRAGSILPEVEPAGRKKLRNATP
jgi:ParB-like chromosome segregation protein Spo0J